MNFSLVFIKYTPANIVLQFDFLTSLKKRQILWYT